MLLLIDNFNREKGPTSSIGLFFCPFLYPYPLQQPLFSFKNRKISKDLLPENRPSLSLFLQDPGKKIGVIGDEDIHILGDEPAHLVRVVDRPGMHGKPLGF